MSTEPSPPAVAVPPTALIGVRAIAPDLARGAMLLLIALANAPWYLWATDARVSGSAHPAGASGLDAVAQTISLVAIDGRTYPMFAFLFGYGIWQLYSRQIAAGVSRREARRLLRRRHWWMLAFGLVHAALLWGGDIVGAYGLAGLVLTWIFLDRRDTTLQVWSVVLGGFLVIGALLAAVGRIMFGDSGAGDVESVEGLDLAVQQTDYLQSIPARIEFWALATPAQALLGLTVPIAILLALLAARHRVLENPREHLMLLRVAAVIGLVVGWGFGAVAAADDLGAFGSGSEVGPALAEAQVAAGLLCGIGYVAVFGLVAARVERRVSAGRIASALQAVGKRSLSSYLAQSVIMAPVLSAWGFGLGAVLTSGSMALFASATWAVTVGFAVVLDRHGKRGPAEWLLRRLAYPATPARARRPAASTT